MVINGFHGYGLLKCVLDVKPIIGKNTRGHNVMGKLIDLKGNRFGKWVVIGRDNDRKGATYWKCKCDCGNIKSIDGSSLRSGDSTQCTECRKVNLNKWLQENKFIDLTGMRFGKWHVINRSYDKNKARYWLCKCDCGVIRNVSGSMLKKGGSISCGCSKIGTINVKDLTRERFGKLVVIKQASNSKSGVRWWCQCDCGSKPIRRMAASLSSGKSLNCGCDYKTIKDLSGKKFGKLTVIKRSKHTSRGVSWLCKCECGNDKIVASNDFSGGIYTQSCGCAKLDGIKQYMSGRFLGIDASLYDVLSPQIKVAEKTRRDPENKKALQVKCTKCKKWFTPTRSQVRHRVDGLNQRVHKDKSRPGKYRVSSEGRFYCSDECKQSCSIYGQIEWPKGFRPDNYRNEILDPDLNILVLNRDSYQCQKCGATEDLNVHHIEGVAQEPMLANDIDNCITVCHSCHVEIHSQPGCTYFDYQREACEQLPPPMTKLP